MATTAQLRGDIIERSANLETLIGCVISTVYFGKVVQSFTFDFLGDEYCSFALKRRVLLKVAPKLRDSGEFEQKLNRMNTIRNYFAHVGMSVVATLGDGAEPRIPDPRRFDRSVDFPALHKEFLELEKPVVSALVEQYKSLGGQLE